MKKTYSVVFAGLFAISLSYGYTADWRHTNGLKGACVTSLAANGRDLFAGTRDSGVYLSADSGANWRRVAAGLSSLNIQALALRGAILFAGTQDSGVFRTDDSGAHWQAINVGLSALNVQALAANDSFLFAGTGGGGVCHSADSGAHWVEDNHGLVFKNIFSLSTRGTYVFAGTWGGSAFRSADHGQNWFLVTNGLFDPRENIIPYAFAANDSFTFAGLGGRGVFWARDSARVWFPDASGLPDSAFVRALALSGTDLFASTQKGVYRSTVGGATWTVANDGLTDSLVLCFAVEGTNLFAGTPNGVWICPLTEPPVALQADPGLPPSLGLDQNTPNPFNPAATIRYTIPTPGLASLTVYDFQGRQVAVLAEGKKPAGEFSASFNAAGLANGVYFYRLKAGGLVKTRVMLLAR